MKKLIWRFRRIRFLGHRYAVLTLVSTALALLWAGICLLCYPSQGTLPSQAGHSLAFLSLCLSPALLLWSFYRSWAQGIAHRILRVGVKTLLVLSSLLLAGYGFYECKTLWPLISGRYWQQYLEAFARPALWALAAPAAIAAGIPAIYYQLSKLADYRFFRRHLKSMGGSARWAGPGTYSDKKPKYIAGTDGRTPDIVVGATRYLDDPYVKTVAVRDNSNLMLTSTMGGGKSATILFPLLGTYAGSAFVNDPKGEHARTTYARRAQSSGSYKGRCFMLDPFGINTDTGLPAACYTLLSEIDITKDNALSLINAIAEACVPDEKNDKPHFVQLPRQIIAGVIAHVLSQYPIENHNLPFILDLFYGTERFEDGQSIVDPDKFDELLLEMAANDVCGGVCQRAARDLKTIGDNEKGSILSTVSRSLSWAGAPSIRKHLSGTSDFKFSDIGIDGFATTLYVVFPFGEEGASMRWMRALFNIGIALMRRPQKPKYRTLLVLDEFSSLGAMESIKKGIATLREYRMQAVVVIQNIAQLKAHFGEEYSTFIANSNKLYFGVADLETANEVSGSLGRNIVRGEARELMSAAEVMTDLSKDANRLIYLSATATKGRDNLPMLLERLTYIHYTNGFRHYPGQARYYAKEGLSAQYLGVAPKRKFSVFSFHQPAIFNSATEPESNAE